MKKTKLLFKLLCALGLFFTELTTLSAGTHKNEKQNKACYASADLSLRAGLPNVLSNTNPVQFDNTGVVRGLVPPDSTIAAGPKSVICMVNCMIAIHRKDTLEQIFLDSTTNFFEQGIRAGDVWAIYDQFSERFFLLGFRPFVENDVQLTHIFVAVSKNCNPQNSDDFFKYRYLATEFADYPKMAVDKEAVYITTNDYDIDENLVGATIAVFRKKPLEDGSSLYEITPIFKETIPTGTEANGGDVRFIFPCQPRPSAKKDAVEKVILVQPVFGDSDFINSGNKLRIYQVKNTLKSPSLVYTDIEVPFFTFQDGFNGSGSTLYQAIQPPPVINTQNKPIVGLETIMGVFHNGVISENSLWTSHVIFSNEGYRKIVRWYEIDVSKFLSHNKLKLIQAGNVDAGGFSNQILPSLSVDKDGNMGIQFTLVGEQQYPAIAYTGRLKTDPKGTVRMPFQIPIGGDLYYQVTFAASNRYGDYSGISIDPCDGKTFWFINQYPFAVDPNAKDSLGRVNFGFGSNWTTFLGAYQVNHDGTQINAPQTENVLQN